MAIEFTCDLCGKKIGKDDIYHRIYPDDATACYTCSEQVCFCCDDCGHYWRPEYLTVCDDGDWLCPQCLWIPEDEWEALKQRNTTK